MNFSDHFNIILNFKKEKAGIFEQLILLFADLFLKGRKIIISLKKIKPCAAIIYKF